MIMPSYLSRVSGCWLGKNIGGTLGMPMEWERRANSVTYYTHDLTGDPLPNDDLDIQILWLLAMEEHGVDIDAKVLGAFFNQYMIFTHAEYGTAKTNLRAGLQPPVSGTFNNRFKDSCGSFIRADIWACLYPGHPALAAKYAFEDAIVDHGDGEGVYAEVFVAAMESAAFVITDVRELIRIGLTYIPDDCAVARAVRDAVATFDRGIPFEESREYIMQHYIGHIEWHPISEEDEQKGYGEGPMGWDVPSNIMIIVYSLLLGGGDVEKAMCTAVNYGEDTDCTAGTIAALYGLMYGREIFSEKWTKPIGSKIVTISINPFLMYGKIPATVDELTERVAKLHEAAFLFHGLSDWAGESLDAPAWFRNIYDEMHVVRYFFPGLNVRLDYMGAPVLRPGESKRIRFILSNTSRAITSDRLRVYLYARSGVTVSPAAEQAVFLTMNHMGDGIKEIFYDITSEHMAPGYRFVAEFVYEDSHNNQVMTIPFVLLGESGQTLPPKWEKRGSRWTPNLPRI
ncbi:MAG: ADP-ribosylglycohydrolase family protein [Clostridia bacterium]|nr:ADP-ribosylglycohydrolase family protein [Clostridia bacterium]